MQHQDGRGTTNRMNSGVWWMRNCVIHSALLNHVEPFCQVHLHISLSAGLGSAIARAKGKTVVRCVISCHHRIHHLSVIISHRFVRSLATKFTYRLWRFLCVKIGSGKRVVPYRLWRFLCVKIGSGKWVVLYRLWRFFTQNWHPKSTPYFFSLRIILSVTHIYIYTHTFTPTYIYRLHMYFT